MASLAGYFSNYFEFQTITSPTAHWVSAPTTADFNGDGYEDLLLLGAMFPGPGLTPSDQQGILLYGSATGFDPAPQDFPWLTLGSIHSRKVLVEDFNGDAKPDVYVASHGWDTEPFPGEQNLLYLSTPTGWVEATATLPQLSDFTHTAAAGDIDLDGDLDIFVGNGYRGQNGILSYMLMNDGAGHFTMTRSNIPAGAGEVLDFNTMHMFPGAEFMDLNGDARPDLVITADATASFNALRENVILWNQGGSFTNGARTVLPANAHLPNQIVTDVQDIDVNGDGRPDMIFTGTQGQPFYDGWFVQVMLSQANGTFIDATNSLMAPADRFGGAPGASTGAPWGMFIKTFDFNYDGFMDFAMETNGQSPSASTPLVWLNDGTGHFSTLKAGDFTSELPRVGTGHWYETPNGWSTILGQGYQQGKLVLSGITAIKPYLETPDSGLARTGGGGRDRLRGDSADNTLVGNEDIDTAVYFGVRKDFTIAANAGGHVVSRHSVSSDVDTLVTVERLEFRDVNVAIDIAGRAGEVAKTLGAVFGQEAVDNAAYAGIGLDLLDGGMAYTSLLELALQVALGAGAGNEQIVSLLYSNVIGNAPSADEVQFYAGLLSSGTFTRGELAAIAADTPFNAARIDLPGLAESGLAYL